MKLYFYLLSIVLMFLTTQSSARGGDPDSDPVLQVEHQASPSVTGTRIDTNLRKSQGLMLQNHPYDSIEDIVIAKTREKLSPILHDKRQE